MFEQLLSEFEDRVREVNLYFQVLAALDNDELSIVAGTAGQFAPEGAPPGDWGRMLKGASYLVLYNLVEAFVRRGFQQVFDTIKSDSVCAADLIEELRVQWIEQKNRTVKHFDGSPGVYMNLAHELIEDIFSKNRVALHRDRLPVSGNLDADKIRTICHLHGVDATVPAAAKGGASLEIVKKKRNSLSHGDESFVEVGRNLAACDLSKSKDEVIAFMRGIIENLEKFAATKSYRHWVPFTNLATADWMEWI